LAAQLDDLATAVEESDSTTFVRQQRWFRSGAASREFTADDLLAALGALESALTECLSAVDRDLWARPIAEATRALRLDDVGESKTALGDPAREFLQQVLAGECRAARAAAHKLVASGELSADQLVEEVLLAAAREAGRLWHLGRLNVAEEHVVTTTVRAALVDLSAAAPAPRRDAPGALIAAIAGDAHDTALHALGALLEYDGWRVSVAGADTPALDIARAASTFRSALVILSATLPSQRHALRLTMADLRAAPGFEAPILVGGGALPDAAMAASVGAEGYAATLSRAVVEARRLIGR